MTIESKNIGQHVAALAGTEVCLGSLVHGLHIPLGGTLLSLNQGYFLSRIVTIHRSSKDARHLGFQVSTHAALLKALSPAGKRLTPMLAITMQGILFSLGTFLAGTNLTGIILASSLLSLWSMIQPVLMTAFVYGIVFKAAEIDRIVQYYRNLLRDVFHFDAQYLVYGLVLFALVKIGIASSLAVAAYRRPTKSLFAEPALTDHLRLKHQLLTSSPDQSFWRNTLAAARDMLKPIFLIPILLTGLFFWFAEHQWAPVIWAMLRPVALAYAMLLTMRILPWRPWLNRWSMKSTVLAHALQEIEKRWKPSTPIPTGETHP